MTLKQLEKKYTVTICKREKVYLVFSFLGHSLCVGKTLKEVEKNLKEIFDNKEV